VAEHQGSAGARGEVSPPDTVARTCYVFSRDASMNHHLLAEERSLAYHAVVAAGLERDPELLEVARRRVTTWLETGAPHPHYARAWSAILASPLAVIRERLLDASEEGRALRQVTPFAGAIDARDRWNLWREVRERHAGT
jgi:hypothetical protein